MGYVVSAARQSINTRHDIIEPICERYPTYFISDAIGVLILSYDKSLFLSLTSILAGSDRFPFAVPILSRNLAVFSDCKLSAFETDGAVEGRC